MAGGWAQFFDGVGHAYAALDPGNRGNSASQDLPVQAGNYEFIQTFLFPQQDAVEIEGISPEFVTPANHGINTFGPSGIMGGGITLDEPELDLAGPASYDVASQSYSYDED